MRLAALALALLAARAALGQPYDPAFRWRTIDTPHFQVHHHQGEEALAQRVAREAERAHGLLSRRLRFEPRQRTQIVLSDDFDDANGSATPLPYDTVRLLAVPPSSLSVLQDYRDWVRQLVLHEYTHILHLDEVGGIPGAANRIFGKFWTPNGYVPAWMIEGLAVLEESDGDPASGRNGSALFDMYARALATEGSFPGLDDASNPFLDWPLGNVPYLLGGRFMGFLKARYGPDALAGFAADQGSRVWPYSPSGTGRRWFGGRTFPELWEEYARAERAWAEGCRARVRRRAVTEPFRLTSAGGEIANPRFSPDGSFVAYFRRDLDRAPGIFRVTPDGHDLGRVSVVDANGTLALRSPGAAVVAIGEVFREFRVYDDLWLLDLRTGARRRLGRGERATDPDVSRDGRTAVYVRRTGGGTMALVRRSLEGGEPEVLYAHGDAQPFMPRIAGDGRVAFELHEDGRRDIAVWQDGRVTKVTDDDALDTGPAWTPDGRFLLFASDRGGIFNLYAWESATGAVRQVTNVETGALQPEPSPDGRTIVFVTYSRAGYDLARIPFDESTWLDPVEPPPARATGEDGSPGEPLPSRPYSALGTVGPTLWLPVPGVDAAGFTFGAVTGGADVLLRHAWLLEGWWSPHAREPGYLAMYQGGWSWPLLDLSSSRTVEDSAGPPDRLEVAWNYADAGATFTFTRLARQLALRIGWSGTGYSSVEGPAPEQFPDAFGFRDGFLSEASLRATYSDARRFVRSISREQGRTVSVRLSVAAPEIGSDFEVARARATVAQYARVPFTAHTVLALRLAGGAAHGTLGARAPFEVGGFAGGDAASLLGGATVGPDQLRGYAAGAFGGTGFLLGSAELRAPLLRPLAGRDTWPLFLRRVHGALFLDAGDAFDLAGQVPIAGHRLAADELRFGAGAELRFEVVLGYYLRTDVRVGVARPLGALLGEGRAADRAIGVEPATAVWYVAVGPSF